MTTGPMNTGPVRAGPQTTALPASFRVVLDPDTRQIDEQTWFGGSPGRIVRLTEAGRRAWDELFASAPATPTLAALAAPVAKSPALEADPETVTETARLARQLTDSGVAHPRPPASGPVDVTVVIPVRDRAAELARCLAALGRRCPVVVVDDDSPDAAGVAAVAQRFGAALVRREVNGGPGAARNSGLATVTTDLVAFVDSDCIPAPGWIQRLAGHFADPLVAAVAPRITDHPGSAADHFAGAGSGLDLGDREARVRPGARVSYVPTAALLVRRAALLDLDSRATVFDPLLRTGEDVDLVWRLHRAGWRIRYDPSVQVSHDGALTGRGLLARRFAYGQSAGPLAVRHRGTLAPLVLHPWPALTVAGLLARSPLVAAGGFAGYVLSTRRSLHRHGISARGTIPSLLTGVHQTWLGTGRYAGQFAAPLVAAALIWPGGRTRRTRWGRRAAAASLLLGPPLDGWVHARHSGSTTSGPVRFAAGSLAAGCAYGAGVWAGCARSQTLDPLRPTLARQKR